MIAFSQQTALKHLQSKDWEHETPQEKKWPPIIKKAHRPVRTPQTTSQPQFLSFYDPTFHQTLDLKHCELECSLQCRAVPPHRVLCLLHRSFVVEALLKNNVYTQQQNRSLTTSPRQQRKPENRVSGSLIELWGSEDLNLRSGKRNQWVIVFYLYYFITGNDNSPLSK